MGFLNQLLKYKNICIQCHNSPDADALAAAYGVYTYLKLHDINVSIIYSGDYEIQKKDLLYMIDICEIPVEYIKELPKTDLLLLVDGQYGRGNVYRFEADNIAMIDHHMPSMKKTENAFLSSILSKTKGVSSIATKAALKTLPQDTRDDLAVACLNHYKDDIQRLLTEVSKQKGIALQIDGINIAVAQSSESA